MGIGHFLEYSSFKIVVVDETGGKEIVYICNKMETLEMKL